MHMMGPKLSSLARNMSSSTSQKMVGDCLTTHPSSAREHVDHTRGEACLNCQLGELQSSQWGHLGRLDHNSVSSCETGGHLPREHHQGVVPGRDKPTHSDRVLASDRKVPVGRRGVVDRHSAPLDLVT